MRVLGPHASGVLVLLGEGSPLVCVCLLSGFAFCPLVVVFCAFRACLLLCVTCTPCMHMDSCGRR
jgi:hypothetical protein